MDITIYHNPHCSKSREVFSLLEHNNIVPKVVLYLEHPLKTTQLYTLLQQLNLRARQLLREKEEVYRDLNLGDLSLSEEALIAAMVKHPQLMERPIIVKGNHAVIGRPPENVLMFLSQ